MQRSPFEAIAGESDPWIVALAARWHAAADERRHPLERDCESIRRAALGDVIDWLIDNHRSRRPSRAANHPLATLGADNLDQLHTTYERLLSYRIAEAPLGTGAGDRSSVQLDDRCRRQTGSFFTPPALRQLLICHALEPLIDHAVRQAVFAEDGSPSSPALAPARWSGRQRERAVEAILSLRICDPACGPGGFLLSAGTVLVERLAALRPGCDRVASWIEVLRHCLHGVDIDPLTLRLARFSLWVAAGEPNLSDEALTPHLHGGDSLGLAVAGGEGTGAGELHANPKGKDGLKTRPPGAEDRLGWERLFPTVFGDQGGFDCILGNPPFANAIEGQISPAKKQLLRRQFPELTGTADLAYYFLALAHRLTRPAGAVGLVLPRGVLSAPATGRLRTQLLRERPPALIYAPDDPFLFPGANVFVVLLALRQSAGCRGSRERNGLRLARLSVTGANWWSPLVTTAPAAARRAAVLGESFEVFASMTAGMAYELLPFVQEEDGASAQRLVTTGLIEPGQCQWGVWTCRYLKHDFGRPVIRENGLPPGLVRRLEKVRRPKVLVAGLSNRVEAFLDPAGVYCGAVSTVTILDPEDDVGRLARLCAGLNRPPVSRRLVNELGAHALGGGRITIGKHFLRSLPLAPLLKTEAAPADERGAD